MAREPMPITKVCERPGFTGQYCEFPICHETNYEIDPHQYENAEGYVIDVAFLGNCSRIHTLLIDDELRDIHILVQSEKNNRPRFILTDQFGEIHFPDREYHTENNIFECLYFELPAGVYMVTPEADSRDALCVMTAEARTPLTISGGFIVDERERSDFPNKNAQTHAFNSIILHGNGLRSPGSLKSVEVIGPNNFVSRARLLEPRFGCGYEYYFDALFCFNEGSYTMLVEGVDFRGNLFRRAASFLCMSGPPPPTASTAKPTEPTPPKECENGGILVTTGIAPKCICQDHFGGPTCSQALCVNGGTQSSGDCFCPIGFHGRHCEEVSCTRPSTHDFDTDHPTFVLILRARKQMADVIKNINDAISKFEGLLPNQEYFSKFHLVLFNNDKVTLSQHYTSYSQVSRVLNTTNFSSTEGGCTDSIFGSATSALMDIELTPKSVVYVVTDALADDHDEYAETLFQWNSYWRAAINFVYVKTDDACSLQVDDPGFHALEDASNRFNGLAFEAQAANINKVFLAHLESTFYRTQLMMSSDRPVCNSGLPFRTVQIDRDIDTITIVGKGRKFAPILSQPGKAIASELVVQDGDFYIYKFNTLTVGTYLLQVSTVPATFDCSFRIYQSTFKGSYTARKPEIFWSLTTDIDMDGILMQPLTSIEAHPVFHVSNFEFASPDHAMASLNIYAMRNGKEQEVYASSGLYRAGCQYNYYFPAFQCYQSNELLQFEFFVRNADGFYIQRSGAMYCQHFHPTPAPPDSCQNGGVMRNGTCFCQPHFTGNHCERIECMHNGKSGPNGRCECASGFAGQFCELPTCHEKEPYPRFGYRVHMAFVVEITKRGVVQIQSLMSSIGDVMRDISLQHREWIDRYVIVGYNSTWAGVMHEAPSNNYASIIQFLNTTAQSNPTDNGCVVHTWEALRTLLAHRELPPRSVINLFETGIPDNIGQVLQAVTVSEDLLERRVHMNVFQQAQDNLDFECNGNWTDFEYLNIAARRGDGRIYNVAAKDIPKVARIIPTVFSSSMVYHYVANDCLLPQDIYFPIDSHTQTLTATVFGTKANTTLYRYDGSKFIAEGTQLVHNDEVTVTEYRSACELEWEEQSQYCVLFDASAGFMQHDEAKALCASKRSFLVDDLSDEKNVFIRGELFGIVKVWLGLKLNDGKWYFEHEGNLTSPVVKGYWVDDIVPTDPTKPCAYFDPTSTQSGKYWRAAPCTDKFVPVCQKHKFDNEHTPSRLGDDDLSPGKYYLSIQTQPSKDHWNGCSVDIRVQSDLVIASGFTDELHKDMGMPVANIDSNRNYVVATVAVGGRASEKAVLSTALFRSEDVQATLLEAANYMPRMGCSYEYISEDFSCKRTNGRDFMMVNIGEDETGNTFQRYTTTTCSKWVFMCLNGGVYSNGRCVCRDLWRGEACTVPICQNNGKLIDDRRCECPSGFGGHACQFHECKQNSNTTFTNDEKTLALLVESSQNTAQSLDRVADSLADIVKAAMAQHSKWFTNYIIYSFKPDGSRDHVAAYANVVDAAIHLKQIALEAKSVASKNCTLPIFDALKDLFGNFVGSSMSNDEILLITAGTPDLKDVEDLNKVLEEFGTQSPTIDYIHVDAADCDTDDINAAFSNFSAIIGTVGGTVYRTTPDTIVKGLTAFLPSRYAPQVLNFEQSHADCSSKTYYVQVDAEMKEFYITVTGQKGSVRVFDGLTSADLTPIDSYEYQGIWKYQGRPGTYGVQVNTTSPSCFTSIYGSGGIQVVFGFLQDPTGDKPTPFAVYGVRNWPVYHIVDPDQTRFERGVINAANMYRRSTTGQNEMPYFSETRMRLGCSYSFISEPFECHYNNEFMEIIASGEDTDRQVFNRHQMSWCKGNGPISTTTASPTTTTKPIGPKDIKFDIVFLVDESTDDQFYEKHGENWIMNLLSIYTANQAHVRVGLINLPGEMASDTMPATLLSAIDSNSMLKSNLDQFSELIDVGNGDEFITTAFQYTNDPYKYRSPYNGYRSEINNHIIVLLTENTNFKDLNAAVTEVAKIKATHAYDVISVGFGGSADKDKLAKLSSADCTFMAADDAELNGRVTKLLQDKIWRGFKETNGAYCT